MKKWRDSDFECPDCGNTVMVETAAEEGYYYDGDDLYCPVCHCEGQVIIDGDDAWEQWDY